jgi:glycosyltransferase involved in cell wall biosynthesis
MKPSVRREGLLRIVHTVSSLRGGGMEAFVIGLCAVQRRLGHDASVMAIHGGPLAPLAEQLRLPVVVLERGDLPRRLLAAARAMRRLRPQIVHAHNPTSLQYAALGRLVTGGRIVLTDHAQTRGIVRVPSRLEWRLTDAVVAVSADTASKTPLLGYSGHVEVIHNGIEFRKPGRSRAEVRAALGLGEQVVAIHVAGFVPVKAHDTLVRALADLGRRGAPVTLLAVGDGPERPRIEQLARDAGLGQAQLRFLGFRTDVADLLAASDLFVLPSRAEGLPISMLEAMSHGLPVVATAAGGSTEACDDGVQGLVVPIDDPGALAGAIARLAADPALRRRMGDAGLARVGDEFSFERTAERYGATYRRVLDGG